MTSDTANHQALVVAYARGKTSAETADAEPSSRSEVRPLYQPPSLEFTYETYFRYVWRCLKSLGVADANLDDAVQEVFVVVQNKLSSFDGGCDLRTWLYAIVLRIGRRHRAAAALDAKRFDRSLNDEGHPHGSAAADLRKEVENNDQLKLAQRALAYLDDAKREAFVLCFVEGMSGPEIAEITETPLNTVYSRLRAARQEFSFALSDLQQSPEPSLLPHEPHSARNKS